MKSACISGNEAIAYAMNQINPDVVAAFPITPSTEIPQYFSAYVADGLVDTEFVAVESEHSAMSACIGAQAAGARAMTATSSNGLALMWECIYIAAGLRLPILMACVNRTLAGPLNIHNDHSDSMGARDSGWIQLYSENNQEAYDNMLMAHRIAEHPLVNLPVMVCQDGFITSHAVENIELLDDEVVKNWIGKYQPENSLLNVRSVSVGPNDHYTYYFEHKRQQAQAMRDSLQVIEQISTEFGHISGRKYSFFESYQMDDAEVALVLLSSTAGTAKTVVDELRLSGIKAGLIKLRVFRPFPGNLLADALKNVKAIAIMDKVDGVNNAGGPLYTEISSALFQTQCNKSKVINYIYGLGGRDVSTRDIRKVFDHLESMPVGDENEVIFRYLGVREEVSA